MNTSNYRKQFISPLCSPTRSTLQTGRNHHLSGYAAISEMANGFPGYSGRFPEQVTTIAEVLSANGYATFWLGKDHNVPEPDVAPGAFEWFVSSPPLPAQVKDTRAAKLNPVTCIR